MTRKLKLTTGDEINDGVMSGGVALHKATDGSFSDNPWFPSVFGLRAPAAKVLQSLRRAEPVLIGWGPVPALLKTFSGDQIALPTNGLAEAII